MTKNTSKNTARATESVNTPTKVSDKLSEAEGKAWSEKRKALLTGMADEIAALPASKLLELASQRVARLLDEKHNSAESKRDVCNGKAEVTLDGLLSSNRLSAASKEITQDSFLALLTSGKLDASQLAEAAAIFKSGKLKEMQAFCIKVHNERAENVEE